MSELSVREINYEIENKLLELVNIVNVKNKMNLYDINIACESLFCEILNVVFEMDLKVLNIEGNYRKVAVDLGDENRAFYIQITSNKRKEKISETLRKFDREYRREDRVVIFIIGKKILYDKIEAYGRNFVISKDLWDVETIINNLPSDYEKSRKVLLAINKFYDSGITNICKYDINLAIDKSVIDIGMKKKYSYGMGDVRVDAFLPNSYKDELSILLTFRKKEVEDAWITFKQEDAKRILFRKDNNEIMNRNFVLFEEEGKVWLQLLNVRFSVEYTTAENLCTLLDDLQEEYNKCIQEQIAMLGTKSFSRDNEGDVVLVEVPLYIWESMLEFAQDRDYGLPNNEWNIFSTTSFCRNRIMVYKNMNLDTKGNVRTQLFCKGTGYGGYVSIIWRPGFTALDNPCEEFDNVIKWKADYTYDWLINEFIPRALFEKERKWYYTYGAYKKKLNLRERGVYCLKND